MRFGTLAFAARHERTPEEAQLVRRLDIFLMTFGCISQDLDQTNISNAYVSGMKEDLNLYGNEYNYFTTYFNIAYCIMLIPSQVILTYVRPSYWLSGLEVCWGVITGMFALVKTAQHVYVLRVLLGLCESSAWPGMMTLLMHWYTPSELAKRMGFYHSCQAVGSMMSGALQVAIRSSMHGLHGLPGWRWLFVVNAIMTVVVGAMGFVLLPDTPNNPNPRAFWFKKEHARLAMERLERHGKAEPKKMTWAAARRAFKSWVIYFLPVLYIATVLETYGNNYFNLFLKSLKNADGSPRWTTSQVNAIPIGASAINVVFAVIGLAVCIAMSVWSTHPTTTPLGTAYASFFIIFTAMGTAPLIFAWLADLLPQDPEARTLIVGVSIAGYYAISAWSQVLVWPATQAPYYKYAWQSSIAIGVLVIGMVCVLRYIDVKYLLPKREAYRNTVIEAAVDAHERAGSPSGDSDRKVKSTATVPEV
ncbi:pantothenate transporter [Colletotrichum musicola]|uniref:Pantothenate transporter n=1 Tax=Colletotrichum musicola TaxID=2175873 RepID=A0A8H6NPH4_9PEZI|nr:pantothenate transporter [Colletotrichum musicola]